MNNELILELLKLAMQQESTKTNTEPVKDQSSPWVIGENYCIRTVTMIQTGKLVAITKDELILEEAAWVADTGRFSAFLNGNEPDEVELFPSGKVIIGRGGLIDACIIKNIPKATK
jgi:hypothetical protein